jgi:hypothetical protein
MKKFAVMLGLMVALVGCARKDALEIPTGTDVTVQKHDGVSIAGRLVEVKPEQVVLESRDGVKTQVRRSDIASIRASSVDSGLEVRTQPTSSAPNARNAPAPASDHDTTKSQNKNQDAESRNPVAKLFDRKPEYREVTIPAGTTLPLELTTSLASDTSHVEDQVRARLRSGISMDGAQALPAGTVVVGHVTGVERSAKVKGRASIAFRFNQIDLPGQGGREDISTGTISRVARATKKKDATKIGVGAGAGAVIGGLLGGGDGAAKGAAIGGGAGTAAVLATRGEEVRIPAGTSVSARLTAPLTVRVPMK